MPPPGCTDAPTRHSQGRHGSEYDGRWNGPAEVNDAALWGAVTDLLAYSPAPPALRQALFEVAAGLSGTTVRGEVTDSQGRPGIFVINGVDGLILDPETGLLLERVWDDGSGELHYRATYVSQGPTDSAPFAPYPDLPEGCTLDMHCDGGYALLPSAQG